jgi:hypothetical protein
MLHNEHTHAFEIETVLQLPPMIFLGHFGTSRDRSSRTSIYVLRQNRSS